MRLCLCALFLFFVAGCSLNPVYHILESSLPKVDAPYRHKTIEAMIPTASGEELYTTITTPIGAAEPSCLLVRIPLPQGFKYNMFRDAFSAVWARRGYRVIIQNVQGFPPSTGRFEPFVHEREDGETTMLWLAENGSCREILSWGNSYFGITQWAIGDLYSGAKAIQISSPRLGDVFFPGGAFALSSALFWTARNRDLMPGVEEIREAAAAGPPLSADERLLGEAVPYYREWLLEGRSKAYWNKLMPNVREKLRGPVLLMAGWYDPFLPAMLKDHSILKQREEGVKLVIGPWAHAITVDMPDGYRPRNYRFESAERPMRWLECLRSQAGEECFKPEVEIFLMGANRWVALDQYPPRDSRVSLWRIEQESGILVAGDRGISSRVGEMPLRLLLDRRDPTPGIGGVDLGFDVGPESQRKIIKRTEVFSAISRPLAASLQIIGKVALEGQIAGSGCSPDLAVTLLDVFPDDEPYLLTEGILRLKDRQSEFRMELWPTAYELKQGHRLGMMLAPAKFPKYDLPECLYKKSEEKLALTLEGLHSWRLLLPITTLTELKERGT